MANGVFTREALSAMVEERGSVSKDAYVEIPVTKIPSEGDTVTISGVLCNFKEQTLAKDPEFAAIGFVDIDTDGDGSFDKTVYGAYRADACASVKSTLTAARTGASVKEQGWIDSLLSRFGA